MTLTIDLTAATRAVSDDEFRAWAASHSLFLSSVMGEFAVERRVLAKALDADGFRVRWFEAFGGRDDPPDAAYLSEVAGTDIYVGLVGDSYGAMHPTGFAATHEEYLEARRCGKRVTFWVRRDDSAREGHARNFVSEVQAFNVVGRFDDVDDLVRVLLVRLREMAAEDISPWVKLGEVVFRAERITEAGRQLTVDGHVREAGVVRALRALTPDAQWGRARTVPVSYGDRSGVGRVGSLEVETRTQATQLIKLVIDVEWAAGRSSTAVSFQGIPHEELVEVGIRAGLLHEPVPQALTGLGTSAFVDTTDPLADLAGVQLAEGSVQPVARLLAVEHLVGSRRVAHIDDFSLGPPVQGRRHLRIAWSEYPSYTSSPAGRRAAEGDRPWG